MISWYYMVVISLILLTFLAWKEWTRKNKAMLIQRLLACLLAVGSLLFMAYPYKRAENNISTKNVAVITDGFIQDSLNSFLQNENKSAPVFATDRFLIQAPAAEKMQLITDLGLFSEKYKDDTIHVFGNGFNNEELDLLHDHPIVFHANPVVSSVTSAYWKQQLKAGEPFNVQGQYENVSAHEIKILLQAFNETVDSVIIKQGISQDFSLHTIPKNNGKAVYSLVILSATDTLQNEPLPMEVYPAEPLQLLFLSSSPGFENTFLKNRLSQDGYAVTIRTTISKNKYDKQFLNMPEQAGDQLTTVYLDKFDILIADDNALKEMNIPSLSALRSAIEEKGLGLIIKMNDEQNKAAFYSHFFPVYQLKQGNKAYSFIHTAINDSSNFKIKIEEPAFIRYQPGTQILLQDEQSTIFASGAAYGNGKIVATTLTNTYSLGLSGNTKAYQAIWSLLLQKAAKKIAPDEIWQTRPAFSFVNDPLQIQLETSNTGIPQGQVGDSKIYLKQNSFLPWQWQGTYWPAENGWQSLIQSNGEIDGWYVYKKNDWKKLLNFQKLKETKQYAALHPVTFTEHENMNAGNLSAYLPLCFLILFFICCAFLWIEQKSR